MTRCAPSAQVFPPMASLARRVIAANGMENVIKVVGKRSSDTVVAGCSRDPGHQPSQEEDKTISAGDHQDDMDGKADVLVTEIFDSELLGEGLLPTLRDAVPRLLKVRPTHGSAVNTDFPYHITWHSITSGHVTSLHITPFHVTT